MKPQEAVRNQMYAPVKLSDADKSILRNVWHDPEVSRVLQQIHNELLAAWLRQLVYCNDEQIPQLRALVKAIDHVFAVIATSIKTEPEVEYERTQAAKLNQRNKPTV